MFLAFFSSLLIVLGLMSSSLKGNNGPELATRLAAILPPGSWQLVSDLLLRKEVSPLAWVLIGWGGMLVIGSQVMKLTMEGIHMIYGDRERPSFLGRQLRGLLLFSVSIMAWLIAAALSVFGWSLRHWITGGLGSPSLDRALRNIMLPVLAITLTMLVLTLIYHVARPRATTWNSVLPGATAATILWWFVNLLFGMYVRKMQYGLLYGGMAAAIGLMAWMESSAMIIFLGAAWNAESSAQPDCGQHPKP